MVLGGKPPGRVGRRRIFSERGDSAVHTHWRGRLFPCPDWLVRRWCAGGQYPRGPAARAHCSRAPARRLRTPSRRRPSRCPATTDERAWTTDGRRTQRRIGPIPGRERQGSRPGWSWTVGRRQGRPPEPGERELSGSRGGRRWVGRLVGRRQERRPQEWRHTQRWPEKWRHTQRWPEKWRHTQRCSQECRLPQRCSQECRLPQRRRRIERPSLEWPSLEWPSEQRPSVERARGSSRRCPRPRAGPP